MAGKAIFLKKGFDPADTAPPDFELLVLKFNANSKDPQFREMNPGAHRGLVIMRSPQCPYSVKNVEAIIHTAKKMGLEPALVETDDHESAQQSPCASGTFCIIHNGEILSHHPISNTRFENIMKSRNTIYE